VCVHECVCVCVCACVCVCVCAIRIHRNLTRHDNYASGKNHRPVTHVEDNTLSFFAVCWTIPGTRKRDKKSTSLIRGCQFAINLIHHTEPNQNQAD
jgi:hypothetical protein